MTGMTGDELSTGRIPVVVPSVPRPTAIGGFVAAQLPYVTLIGAAVWVWYVYAGRANAATLRVGAFTAGLVVLLAA